MWKQAINYGHSDYEYDHDDDIVKCDICGEYIYDERDIVYEIFQIICASCNETLEKTENESEYN
jgi:ribosomal protein S27E